MMCMLFDMYGSVNSSTESKKDMMLWITTRKSCHGYTVDILGQNPWNRPKNKYIV